MILRSLYGRIAVVLMVVFFAVGALMILAVERMVEAERLVDLATALIIGTAAFSLGAALIVFRFLTRRLRTLSEAIDAFRASGFTTPIRVPEARADGDEVERLASAFEEMSARIAHQLQALAQVDDRRRELLANVSHDLRTPLTAMQGYLETLLIHEGRLAPEEHRSYLQVATRHCERLAKLVSDLFELTKLEAKEAPLALEAFPLPELAQDVVQKFQLKARQRGIHLAMGFAPDCPAALADIGLIERVMENLIENALRHTPEGGDVHIHVGPAGDGVEMKVADTGEGIPASQLDGVFDRYYQVDRGEASTAGAAGLGLAITRRIVELHGGEIGVESVEGQGATFVVRLPAAVPN
ncbi:MAG: HAMP domain-containing histidine kinase [Zoogloeaceae bacterium]|nr:HAMP domain-containing histidine kinase [Zoogloeaceae bacterium]